LSAFFLVTLIKGQNIESPHLIRATLGAAGSSQSITINNKPYVVQQSIGQLSAIGTFNKAGYTLRQGFIQPNVLAKIVDTKMPIDLEVTFYPNPFVKDVSIAFTQEVKGNIQVVIFDMLGKLVFSKNVPAVQVLKMQFDNLSLGGYILKITANKKQLIKNIIKTSFH